MKAKIVIFMIGIMFLVSCGGQVATPTAAPGKILFSTDRLQLQPGECTLLHWEVIGGFGVTLNSQPVDKTGQMEICPTGTRGYELVVDMGTRVERRTLEITVSGEPAGAAPTPAAPAVPAYQAEAWVALGGPPGDLGYDIRYNFDDHDTWYVTDGSGGFFISNDRGLSWHASNAGIASLEGSMIRPVFSTTVDPHDPRVIWLGTQIVGHIYKSTDGGATWVEMDAGVEPNVGLSFRGFTVDPRSSDTVYAMADVECHVLALDCVETTIGTRGGRVYRTTNGGLNWEIIWEGGALARYLWINPLDPQTMYVSTGIWDRNSVNMERNEAEAIRESGLGILKTTDGGRTWRILGRAQGLEILHVGSLYMHPNNPDILLAGTGHTGGGVIESRGLITGGYGGVFLTTDGGETWSEVVQDDVIGAVEFCDHDPVVAYAAGAMAVYRSDDGGQTWQEYGDPQRGTWGPEGIWPGVPIDLQVDPDDCNRVFINNYVGGNFLSTDGGQTWAIATRGYTGSKVFDVEVDPQDPSHVFAGVRMGTFVSQDGGYTWTGISNYSATGNASFTLDPGDASHILASFSNALLPGSAFETKDEGNTWKALMRFSVPPGLVEGVDQYGMHFVNFNYSPSDPQVVYAPVVNPIQGGMESAIPEGHLQGLGIYRSRDGGSTWEPANDPSTESRGFGALAVDPSDSQVVLAGSLYGDGIFKTIDGGSSWQPSNTGLPSPLPRIQFLAYAPSDPQVVLAGGLTGLFHSLDGGATWTQLTAGLDPFVGISDIAIDPSNPQVIYVGTSRLGVYGSTDGGATFQPLTQGLSAEMGQLPVLSLTLSADGSVLYAGTSGLGLWRLGTP